MTRRTKRDDLVKFLREVRPIQTEHPLIRIGGDSDGGYLTPDDLAGITACFSPGVERVATFETEMARRGIPSFMADYSVDRPPVENPLFHFEKKYLGPQNDAVFMTLGDWVDRNAPNAADLILQMDIEGAEYSVLLEASSETLRKFRIIIAEFHHFEEMWHRKGYELIRLTFLKLLKDFDILHIHPNNKARGPVQAGLELPPLLEFAFLRKDRIRQRKPSTNFPHPLDRKNLPNKPDYILPRCWFASE